MGRPVRASVMIVSLLGALALAGCAGEPAPATTVMLPGPTATVTVPVPAPTVTVTPTPAPASLFRLPELSEPSEADADPATLTPYEAGQVCLENGGRRGLPRSPLPTTGPPVVYERSLAPRWLVFIPATEDIIGPYYFICVVGEDVSDPNTSGGLYPVGVLDDRFFDWVLNNNQEDDGGP